MTETVQERLLIVQRLNTILESYDRTILGQEIIFEEIESIWRKNRNLL